MAASPRLRKAIVPTAAQQIDQHVEALDVEITSLIAADTALTRLYQILTSIAGVGR